MICLRIDEEVRSIFISKEEPEKFEIDHQDWEVV